MSAPSSTTAGRGRRLAAGLHAALRPAAGTPPVAVVGQRRRRRRVQGLLTGLLVAHVALLDVVMSLGDAPGTPALAAATVLVLALLAVTAAPLLLPAARVPHRAATAAAAVGLLVAAVATGTAWPALPVAATTAHVLLLVVVVVAVAAVGHPGPGARRRGDAPLVVHVDDAEALRDLLVDRLAARPGRPLALLRVRLEAGEGPDGAGTDPDDVLHAVTARTAGVLRGDDVVVRLPCGDLAVLLDGGTADSARRVGERVRTVLVSGVVVAGALVDVDAAVGAGRAVTAAPGERSAAADADRLLAQVEAALDVARETGTGVAVVDPDEREGARLADLALLRADLRAALDADEEPDAAAPSVLDVRWTPRFDVRRGRWTTATAELVWHRPDAAGRAPAPLELGAGTSLAPDLFSLLLGRAVAAAAAWRRDGVPVVAAVALPAGALGRQGLVDLVTEALAGSGAAPADLRLLVADADVARDPSAAATALARLSVLGVAVAVTGLGASSSSVASLGSLPVDEVVVDPALVCSTAAGREEDARLVRAVVGLGHGLGLRVVAAGVHDERVHRAVVGLGCDAVQGAHVAPATGSAADVTALVRGASGAELLAPARRPLLPSPRRPEGA
ncbi:EAL domain-containing protein [Pseudokineococcus lusitanus]|uniref:EAL domain-containing protein (Putative c-di-GMP-specific phosphodiesterase class I) n=1 Tax=Pseudokineococcus lusitanus TaxID=763993 RepID=A0A3N1HR02_9ACTN|nr:EAL domain-containing protein [Pseudokineococcus lusitanus]ROP44935.1 EAL domain-containing protein (putative c-di-GMP-specific phosphodiesterase class I) [Pseudokineococcus lusitanus]